MARFRHFSRRWCLVLAAVVGFRLLPCACERVSPERCLLWGPGLQPDLVLPVRYFYIQAVDERGANWTVSPGKDSFRVKITSMEQQHVRIHVPAPLDRGDGSFLVRYRLYGSARAGLRVEVLHQDSPVAGSPYILAGPVYHEYCDCPEPDASAWQRLMQCPAQEPQVQEDFRSFPSVDLERLREEVPGRFSNRGGLIHYTLLDNRLFRRTLGKYTDFKMFSDEMLLSLTRKVKLPDLEFYINVGDWPLESRRADAGPVPVLSWCGSTETRDIVLPTYEVTHSTLEAMRGVTNDLLSVQGHTGSSVFLQNTFLPGVFPAEGSVLVLTLRSSVGEQDGPGLLPRPGQSRGAPPSGHSVPEPPGPAGRRHHGLVLLQRPGEGVQVPGERGRHGGCVPLPLPDAGQQPGAEAGLAVLRTLLHAPATPLSLPARPEGPVGPAGEDPLGQGERHGGPASGPGRSGAGPRAAAAQQTLLLLPQSSAHVRAAPARPTSETPRHGGGAAAPGPHGGVHLRARRGARCEGRTLTSSVIRINVLNLLRRTGS
ncbi:protein O-glucosyltransferase 3 isoform 2-T2 [Synchiropus picturatus]